ncbi:MAG: hypothetical protein V1724_03990 [Chloroflexota bacterium]
MATRVKRQTKAKQLEEKHNELIKMVHLPVPQPIYRDNLEQPSPLRIVDSVTTYSAYEEPI